MFFHNINPALAEIGPFQIRYYGLFYALGFVIAYFLIYHLAKQKKLDLEHIQFCPRFKILCDGAARWTWNLMGVDGP